MATGNRVTGVYGGIQEQKTTYIPISKCHLETEKCHDFSHSFYGPAITNV